MDAEIEAVSRGSSDALHGSGKKGASAKVEASIDPFESEESLSQAILNYSALSREEQKDLVLEVKRAARRDHAPQLKEEQEKKMDADIRQLSSGAAQ